MLLSLDVSWISCYHQLHIDRVHQEKGLRHTRLSSRIWQHGKGLWNLRDSGFIDNNLLSKGGGDDNPKKNRRTWGGREAIGFSTQARNWTVNPFNLTKIILTKVVITQTALSWSLIHKGGRPAEKWSRLMDFRFFPQQLFIDHSHPQSLRGFHQNFSMGFL